MNTILINNGFTFRHKSNGRKIKYISCEIKLSQTDIPQYQDKGSAMFAWLLPPEPRPQNLIGIIRTITIEGSITLNRPIGLRKKIVIYNNELDWWRNIIKEIPYVSITNKQYNGFNVNFINKFKTTSREKWIPAKEAKQG